MSLLLEALKKAEKAKEEAQRRAREGGEPAAEAPVVTREKLPEVNAAPLEIRTEPLAPSPTASAAAPRAQPIALELEPDAPAPAPPSRPAGKSAPKPAAAKPADAEAASRASAKKVFEAKFREPNPRMPFYITLGVLGVFAVGTVVYFWYQLRPPQALVNTNPLPQAQSAQAEPERPVAAPTAPAAPAQPSIPGLPSTAMQAPARPPAPVAAAPVAPPGLAAHPVAKPPFEETPRLGPRALPARRSPSAIAAEKPMVSRSAPQISPRIEAGYNAYMAGDLVAARREYEQALADEPGNRDALLGLAALDVRGGRYEIAEALYLRVLAADPRDAQAQAALVALRSGRSDPLATESRVKTMLAADPAAHVLNFTLGNQFASQRRWAEAQQEYFKAYSAEPDNADFAYNLAVSLDHLRQPRQALDYYQRAITLAEKRGASFNLEAAKTRAAQLGK